MAGPIHSNSAFSPHKGESIWREQVRILHASDDPTSMGRDKTVIQLNNVYIYGFTEKLTGILNVPYIDKSLKSNTSTRNDNGLGDIRTLLKYRIYTNDQLGSSHRLGIFGGLEWPTGDNNESDSVGKLPRNFQLGSGSYDPIFGAVWTTQTLSWEIDADVGYKINNEATGFEFGDELFYNFSYQHRLWPRELPEEGVPSFLYGVLEFNGSFKEQNKISDVTVRSSGGHTVYFSPGLQFVTTRWVVESSVQIPIIQNLYGDALEADYAVTFGVRYRF